MVHIESAIVVQAVKRLNEITRVMIPFMLAGVLMFVMPELLGSGHELIDRLTSHELLLGGAIVILLGKFLFSAVSFGSGAPGGISFRCLFWVRLLVAFSE